MKHLLKCKNVSKCAKFKSKKEDIGKLLNISAKENDLNIYDDNVEDEMDICLSTDAWSADQSTTISRSRTSTATPSTIASAHNPSQIDYYFDKMVNKNVQVYRIFKKLI